VSTGCFKLHSQVKSDREEKGIATVPVAAIGVTQVVLYDSNARPNGELRFAARQSVGLQLRADPTVLGMNFGKRNESLEIPNGRTGITEKAVRNGRCSLARIGTARLIQ